MDLLNNKASMVQFEKKNSSNDKFDDMKVHVGNQLHHYQIKSSYMNNELKIADFSLNGELNLLKLFAAWKELRQTYPDKEMFYHIYTTKSIPTNSILGRFIKKTLPTITMFHENASDICYLKLEILDHKKLKEIKKSLTNDAESEDEIQEFLNGLILETNQPSHPPEFPLDQRTQSPLMEKIMERISDLGLSRSPNYIENSTLFARLINYVDQDSIASHPIMQEDIVSYLPIKKNFGAIKNHIEFDESLYVDTGEALNHLNGQVVQNAGRILGVKGRPGSGKTWLLTRWINDWKQRHHDTPPICYYASISVTGDSDFEKRITRYQILRNLTNAIHDSYFVTVDSNRYAADDSSFKELLGKLNEIAAQKQKVIPIIVDGLDHVDRIMKRANYLPREEETIMDFLNEINIPKHICFVFGTQEGAHLDRLKEKFGNSAFYEISGFNKNETRSYLNKIGVPEELATRENVDLVFQKTSGLPLLISHLGQQLKVENSVEKIQDIPMTQGDVKVYYKYLWKNIESATCSRMFARYFSLLEFPAGTEFLESMRPWVERDGTELATCLGPLQFLLRANQRGEMSIFHDSFRRFILNDTGFASNLQIKYSKDIGNALLTEDIFVADRTFRYALKYRLKSKQFDELINKVNLEFVDNAMVNLCNREDLYNNIVYAIRAASEKEDTISLFEKALLRRYTVQRYQHLGSNDYYGLVLQLWPCKLHKTLITDDRLNLSLDDTIWLLGEGLSAKIELPYADILKIWDDARQKTNLDNTVHRSQMSIPHLGLLLFHNKGMRHVISWIDESKLPLGEQIPIFEKILPHIAYDDIISLKNCNDVQEYWPTLHMFAASHYGKCEQFQTQFRRFVQGNIITYFYRFGDFLKKSKIKHSDLRHLIHKVSLNVPRHGRVSIKNLQEYEQQILLNAYCNNNATLQEYENEIEQNKSIFFYQIVNLVYQYSKASQKNDSELISEGANKLLDSLSEFINYDKPGLLPESSQYDQNFHHYIYNIIEGTIKIIVTKGDSGIQDRLVGAIQKIGGKETFTSLTLDGAYEIVLKYADARLKQLVIGQVPNEVSTSYTEDMVSQCFGRARLFLQVCDQDKAKKNFEKGVRLTFSYGYHKDFLLDTLREISTLLGGDNYLQRVKKSLDWTEYLSIMTDGDYTNLIPSAIVGDIVRIHSGAGYETALKYGVSSYEFDESIINFVKNCLSCTALIRYFLVKTRIIENDSRSYSSPIAFEIRHNLIQECINGDNTALAKFLFNDLRIEIMRDFPQRTTVMGAKFNQVASRLGLEVAKFDARDASDNTNESDPNENVDYSHLSPEEAIQLFEKRHSWWHRYGKHADKLLENSHFKDEEKTEKLINKSLSAIYINHDYEPHEAIHRFGKYLLKTNQIDKLNMLYERIEEFLNCLFRERASYTQKDFRFLEAPACEDNQTHTGCKYIVAQLTSYDTEVQRRAFMSIVNCVRYGSPELLRYCIRTTCSRDTSATLKAKLAAIIHSYVATNNDRSKQILRCARYLCKSNDRRLVTSGMDILYELGVE